MTPTCALSLVSSLVVAESLPVEQAPAAIVLLDAGVDRVWVALSAALVFFMQAGFALLESGSARSKNTVNVIMKNYADLCFGVVAFYLLGFGLMFGSNASGWFGSDHFAPAQLTERDAVFMLFQMMFAATAATIVSGAVAERMRFVPYALASVVVTGLIYPVFGAWAWGSWFDGRGWLAERGFIDFAGSTVVHSVGGWCALAGIIVLGPRLGRFSGSGEPRMIPGHSLPLVALGGFVLWLGWFGFNGGSTLSAEGPIGRVLLNTHIAGASGLIGVAVLATLRRQPLLMSASVNGVIGGLVAITAGCATMSPAFALLTGVIGGLISVLGADLLERLRLDDVVAAVPVHAFCGVWGTLAAGLFHHERMFDLALLGVQSIGVLVAFLWSFPLALACFWLLRLTLGLRADSLHEQRGLDITEHYEVGYPEFQRELTHGGKNPQA